MINHDTNVYVSSKELIGDIIDTYNVQSYGFIPKAPRWIATALGELTMYQVYTDQKEFGDFTESIIRQPWYCREVIELKINGKEAKPPHKSKGIQTTGWFNHNVKTPATYSPEPKLADRIHTASDDIENKICLLTCPTYEVDNGWIHLNIPHGKYELTFRAIPVVYDTDTELTYPVIYNNDMLKKYLKLYVLENMLLSGWVHNILNLSNNNPITNPGLERRQIEPRVRNACNKFTNGRRETLSNILSKWYSFPNIIRHGNYRTEQGYKPTVCK